MQNPRKKVLTFLLLAVLTVVFSGTSGLAKDCAEENQPEPGTMTVDVALVRPLGAVATVAGLAVFVVSFPFSALGGNHHEAWDSLVASPAEFTFRRPLGHFDCEYPPREKQK
jgi:hypothetical protein